MKLKEATDNYEIQIGDFIHIDSKCFGVNDYIVHRITKKYAFVKWNDRAEGKFPRKYKKFNFCVVPRPKWNTIDYSVLIEDK